MGNNRQLFIYFELINAIFGTRATSWPIVLVENTTGPDIRNELFKGWYKYTYLYQSSGVIIAQQTVMMVTHGGQQCRLSGACYMDRRRRGRITRYRTKHSHYSSNTLLVSKLLSHLTKERKVTYRNKCILNTSSFSEAFQP